MSTIKINYGGTTYSMVKTSSKITTPSVKVDGGYIPCFKGDRFAEVQNGNYLYTLSPIMVGDYRMACSSRLAFTDNDHVYVTLSWSVASVSIPGIVTNYNCSISNPTTSKSDFSATISCSNASQKSHQSLANSWTATFSGTYSVIETSSGTVVKSGSFSFSKTLTWGNYRGSTQQTIA